MHVGIYVAIIIVDCVCSSKDLGPFFYSDGIKCKQAWIQECSIYIDDKMPDIFARSVLHKQDNIFGVVYGPLFIWLRLYFERLWAVLLVADIQNSKHPCWVIRVLVVELNSIG